MLAEVSSDVDAMLRRIEARDYVIGIVGLGYVGLPLMLTAAGSGFRTLGFDIDGPRVELLNAGQSPYRHIGGDVAAATPRQPARRGDDRLLAARRGRRHPDLRADAADAAPRARLSFVETTARSIAPHLRPGPAGRAGIDDLARHHRAR